MGLLGALLLMGLTSAVTAGINAAVSSKNNEANIKAQKEANEQNIQMQRETNAQNQYNIEHAHQIEMNDLKAAGLNPVLTATGGSGAPIQTLNSPKVQPVHSDVSGVNNAISGISQMMQSMMMMQMMQANMQERNATLAAIAKGHDATSASNAALKVNSFAGVNRSKASFYDAKKAKILGENGMNSAKTLDLFDSKSVKNIDVKDKKAWTELAKHLTKLQRMHPDWFK